MDDRDTVKLKNGSEEFGPAVSMAMLSLRSLMDEGKGIVVYELAEMCKDRSHKPWGKTGDDLKALSLASEQDGEWHVCGTIRNIVLSAIEGEGMDLTLGSPVHDAIKTVTA